MLAESRAVLAWGHATTPFRLSLQRRRVSHLFTHDKILVRVVLHHQRMVMILVVMIILVQELHIVLLVRRRCCTHRK